VPEGSNGNVSNRKLALLKKEDSKRPQLEHMIGANFYLRKLESDGPDMLQLLGIKDAVIHNVVAWAKNDNEPDEHQDTGRKSAMQRSDRSYVWHVPDDEFTRGRVDPASVQVKNAHDAMQKRKGPNKGQPGE
jgi:hypothetical protein